MDPEVSLGEQSWSQRTHSASPSTSPSEEEVDTGGAVMNCLEEYYELETAWRQNYASMNELTDKVLEVLHDQARRGQVIRMSEQQSRERYTDLVVSSLGAIRKDKPDGVATTRVLFDGTKGLTVHTLTRIRDQERAPIAADLKRAMREESKHDEVTYALTAEVSEAHRQVPVHPQQWHLLGCQVLKGEDVFVNTAATFSVASASYYWSHFAAAWGRLAQYLVGDTASTWHMVVADDYHGERSIVTHCLCSLCCAQQLVCRCHGARLQEGTWWRWSGSSICIALDSWASHSVGQSGPRGGGLWKRSALRRCLWGASKSGTGGSCVWQVLPGFMTLHPRDSIRRVVWHLFFGTSRTMSQLVDTLHVGRSCCTHKWRFAWTRRRVSSALASMVGTPRWITRGRSNVWAKVITDFTFFNFFLIDFLRNRAGV